MLITAVEDGSSPLVFMESPSDIYRKDKNTKNGWDIATISMVGHSMT